MNNFTFSTVPHVISQTGASHALAAHITAHFPTVRSAHLVTDAGFLKTGLIDAPANSLRTAGIHVAIYSDVVADPPESLVLKAVNFAREAGSDIVIGFGGGSSMDVAKLIAVLAAGTQAISAIYGIGNVNGARLPLVQIPTTAGTGLEVTNIAIVTTGATTKTGVVAGPATARQRCHRHRRDGPRHRSIYVEAQKEPHVRQPGKTSTGPAIGKYCHRLQGWQ